MRVAGPDWCSIYSNVIRERERDCRGGSRKRQKMLKVCERQLCVERGCRVAERKVGRGERRMRGRQCYVPASKSRQTKIWSQKVGEGMRENGGIGEVPGPWHCHKQQHRHLRSLPWIFSTRLFLALPTTRHFSLSHYCQHDVTSPTIHAPCFPSLFYSSLYSTSPPNKNRQKTQNYTLKQRFLSSSFFCLSGIKWGETYYYWLLSFISDDKPLRPLHQTHPIKRLKTVAFQHKPTQHCCQGWCFTRDIYTPIHGSMTFSWTSMHYDKAWNTSEDTDRSLLPPECREWEIIRQDKILSPRKRKKKAGET